MTTDLQEAVAMAEVAEVDTDQAAMVVVMAEGVAATEGEDRILLAALEEDLTVSTGTGTEMLL